MESLPAAARPEQITKPTPESYFGTEHIKSDIERRSMRGGFVTIGYQMVKQSLSIGETAIMSRLILPSDSGLINMVVIVTGFISLFNDLGLSAATIQSDELKQEQVSTLFWINIVMGVILAGMTVVSAPFLAWFYNEPRLLPVTCAIAFGFVFGGMTVQHRALLKRQIRFTLLVKIDFVITVVGIVAAITAASLLPSDQRYWALVLELLIQGPVEIVGLWLACRWRPSLPSRHSGIRAMLAFGGNLTGFRIVNYFARNVDNLLIGKFYGPTPLGLYNKAYGLLLLPIRRLTDPFSTVGMPALSRLNKEPERYREFYMQMSSIICLLTTPLIAYMIGASDWIIGVVLAPQWAGVSTLFALLGISGLVEPLGTTTSWLFTSQGRTKEQFHWGFISTGLTVSAILIGLIWGPIGVALSYGISGLLIRTPLLFWYVGRRGPVSTKDLYFNLIPFALTAITILGSLALFREWGATSSNFLNAAIAGFISLGVGIVTLLIQPHGRSILFSLKELPALFSKRK